MDVRQIQQILKNNGFPVGAVDGDMGPNTTAAIRRFQQATVFGWLAVDGVAGPKTQEALQRLPHLSDNFVAGEFACHHCGQAYIKRELVRGLEELRKRLNMPLHIISGYRCPAHNRSVGGASNSMHVQGQAADIPGVAGYRLVVSLQIFSGIGQRNGAISHVDMRHLSDKNSTPNASPTNPVIWVY